MPHGHVYQALGSLLVYPDVNLKESVAGCVKTLKENGSAAVPLIEEFSNYVQTATVADMQEIYTQTFEFNKERALEVGWHLFGERYERGTFIVKMRQTLRELNLAESTELPDHLTHVLAAL
ncbi:MAG: molecular chaperone TorD family protein, partial [candidate division Zixibacteria bacterium]